MRRGSSLKTSTLRPFCSVPSSKALGVQSLSDLGKWPFFSNQLQHQGQNRSFRRILLQVLAIVRNPEAVRSANLDS